MGIVCTTCTDLDARNRELEFELERLGRILEWAKTKGIDVEALHDQHIRTERAREELARQIKRSEEREVIPAKTLNYQASIKTRIRDMQGQPVLFAEDLKIKDEWWIYSIPEYNAIVAHQDIEECEEEMKAYIDYLYDRFVVSPEKEMNDKAKDLQKKLKKVLDNRAVDMEDKH